MKFIKEMNKTYMLGLEAFQISPTMKAAIEVSKRFEELPMMKSIRETNKTYMLGLEAFQMSPTLKAAIESSKRVEESPMMKSIRETNKTYMLGLEAFQMSPTLKAAIEVSKRFEEASIFKALQSLNNSPLNQLLTGAITREQLAPEIVNFSDEYLSEVENELASELAQCTDFNQLSDKTKVTLLYIYHYYILPIILAFIVINIDAARKEFEPISKANEVRALIRNPAGRFNRELLKGHRVIVGANTNMKEEANIKSNTINRLPIGTLIEIIEKSDSRSWLLVDVEINGEIERGWVLRKNTEYFK